jgi:hypothetical protein
LTWNEGEDVELAVVSSKKFHMSYVGVDYFAELRDDGKLHWSDGDVWTRRQLVKKQDELVLGKSSQVEKHTSQTVNLNAPKQKLPVFTTPGHVFSSSGRQSSTKVVTKPSKSSLESAHGNSQSSLGQISQMRERAFSSSDSKFDGVLSSSTKMAAGQMAQGKCVVTSSPIDGRKFKSVVKFFRGSFGWIACEELSKEYCGRDTYVHINDCDFRPKVGDEVEFRLALGQDGGPKAVRVTLVKEPQIIDARDWFAARAKRSAQ